MLSNQPLDAKKIATLNHLELCYAEFLRSTRPSVGAPWFERLHSVILAEYRSKNLEFLFHSSASNSYLEDPEPDLKVDRLPVDIAYILYVLPKANELGVDKFTLALDVIGELFLALKTYLLENNSELAFSVVRRWCDKVLPLAFQLQSYAPFHVSEPAAPLNILAKDVIMQLEQSFCHFLRQSGIQGRSLPELIARSIANTHPIERYGALQLIKELGKQSDLSHLGLGYRGNEDLLHGVPYLVQRERLRAIFMSRALDWCVLQLSPANETLTKYQESPKIARAIVDITDQALHFGELYLSNLERIAYVLSSTDSGLEDEYILENVFTHPALYSNPEGSLVPDLAPSTFTQALRVNRFVRLERRRAADPLLPVRDAQITFRALALVDAFLASDYVKPSVRCNLVNLGDTSYELIVKEEARVLAERLEAGFLNHGDTEPSEALNQVFQDRTFGYEGLTSQQQLLHNYAVNMELLKIESDSTFGYIRTWLQNKLNDTINQRLRRNLPRTIWASVAPRLFGAK